MRAIQMGDTVADSITGYSGVVTGRCEYITGCSQILVQPAVKDGAWQDAKWLDVDRLTVTAAPRVLVSIQTAGFGEPAPTK